MGKRFVRALQGSHALLVFDQQASPVAARIECAGRLLPQGIAMHRTGVISLERIFGEQFPVTCDFEFEFTNELQPLAVVAGETLDQVTERQCQRRWIGLPVHKHEARPAVDRQFDERIIVAIEIVDVSHAGRADEPPVELV